MQRSIRDFLIKPLLVLALAAPIAATIGSQDAEAGKWRKGAVIAGAIVGGAIVYHHVRKHKKHRHHYGYRYGHPRVYYAPRRVYRGRYHRHHHGHYYRPRSSGTYLYIYRHGTAGNSR